VTKAADDQSKGIFAINKFDFRTSALPAAPAVGQPASALDLAPLASSLLNTGSLTVPADPLLKLTTPPPARPSPRVALPTVAATAVVPARATDTVFAAAHAATHDDAAWPFAPFVSTCLDAM
jgi:hypothetical protein